MAQTQSVLDAMTAGIMGAKADKAAKLTPVGREVGGPLAGVPAIPNDLPGRFMAGEELGEAAKALRLHAQTLIGVADSIDQLVATEARRATQDTPPPDLVKQAEADADARVFQQRFAAQQAAAQAAVFVDADATPSAKELAFQASEHGDGVQREPADGGWACPEHGQAHLTTLTSRKGRTYRSCTACGEFEKA